jgi:hypothetical protein
MNTYRITWVETGTGFAASLGLDETIRTDWTEAETREAAEYRAECDGVDLGRYSCLVEEISG